MIKFFRKIRYDLMEKNLPTGQSGKTGKYFKYAFGEIILVVIGILIALQINNWNEERKKRSIENEVLVLLNDDFKTAKKQLADWKKLLENRQEKLKILSENCSLKEPSMSLERMDSLIWSGYALPSFNPPDGTISDLLNSGKIDVLRNTALRNLLSAWNGKLKMTKLQEELQGDFLYNRYTPFIEERVEFKHPRFEGHMNMEKADRFPIDSRDLLKDVRFCNLVRRSIYFNLFVYYHYNGLEKDIDKIIEMTEE